MLGSTRPCVTVRLEASDVFEIDAHRLDAKSPRDNCSEKRRADERIKKDGCANLAEENREEKCGGDRTDLGKRCRKACAGAADLRRKNLARDQISHRIGTEIRHEIKNHKSGKD